MLQKKIITSIAILGSLVANAQTAAVADTKPATTAATAETEKKTPALTISGSVDSYYKFGFNESGSKNLTSFTQTHNTFALGMASVKLEHKGSKVSAVADLGFGQRAKDFAYTDNGITQAIKQLYVSYAPADWIKFTAGSWATHVGYELLDPQLNKNYSMSYMFTNGPFSHTGVKAELTKGKHGFMLGVSNATDYRTPLGGQINKKALLAQYSVAPTEKTKLYLNYVGGQNPDTSKTNQFDIVFTATINSKFSIGLNGTLNSTQFWNGSKNLDGKNWGGVAAYLSFDPKPWFNLSFREEYFSDKNKIKPFASVAKGGSILGSTLTANFKVDNFIFAPELRFDNASENLFTKKNGLFTKSEANILMAVIYSF